ncbi:hypothetical protein MNBD_GAMMA11-3273 [hydrothermal vent metagenome]|uniref:Uncharacterized protein n=1 Tax=hydrothermal vent metagenome TaxID=652676 RepID=A0A3B0XF80_9ZZZZ
MISNAEKKHFDNWSDFEGFLLSLNNNNEWEEVVVFDNKSIDIGLYKKTFKNKITGEIWELVEPDPPFRGSWMLLNKEKKDEEIKNEQKL